MRAAVGEQLALSSAAFPTAVTSASVEVIRSDGTIAPPPSEDIDGLHVRVPLTATDHLDRIDRLTVRIEADGSIQHVTVDVVGSHWLSISDLRSEVGLADDRKHPDSLLAAVRDEWSEYLDDICEVPFVPRMIVEQHSAGPVTVRAHEPRIIRWAEIDGVARTDVPVAPDGVTTLRAHTGATLGVEAGLSAPPPMLVREARKAIAREVLTRSAASPHDRISETFGEGGTIRYSTPDPRAGRWTGLLTLDPVIYRYRYGRVSIA